MRSRAFNTPSALRFASFSGPPMASASASRSFSSLMRSWWDMSPGSSSRALQHVARDDQLLDLAGAFVEAEKAHVAVEALDDGLLHVARAAVDLHAAVGDAPDHLGCVQLAARGFQRDV